MARILASAGALLRHAQAHAALGADWVEFSVATDHPNCGVLTSPTGRTELPVESRFGWSGKGAMLYVPKLLKALKSIPDQPITLDVHEKQPCTLFACKPTGTESGWANIEYTNKMGENLLNQL